MHTNVSLVEARIARFVTDRLAPAVYSASEPLDVSAWVAPGEPVPFAEAVGHEFAPFVVGSRWGRPWGTVWFHVTGQVPPEWSADGVDEIVVDLGFTSAQPGFQCEALAYTPEGRTIKAVEPRNRHVPVTVGPGGEIDVFLEAAANPDLIGNFSDFQFAPTPLGDLATAGDDLLYVLRRIDVARRDVPVWELAQDMRTLRELMAELPADLPRRSEILHALDRAVDVVDPDDVSGTAEAAREVLAGVLDSPAYGSAHRVHAVGHAHIDSAWLWPVRETVRKCARTFSNALDLMEVDPDYRFVASSAQQYAWIKRDYPELFERIAAQVRAGRFVPIGSMWVESDTNMPGGEALVRQLVEGRSFFRDELGVETRDVWLPDSFGYSAALPQIMRGAGAEWFLTQKLSWNETNAMPHHTFLWEGIDGSRIFTHFPPVDTYNAELSGEELARAQRQFREKGQANTSLVPFGWGDGGGGPTREMLAAARRAGDLEGSPRVQLSTVDEFFTEAQREYTDPPVWTGEMYLEFHRGTYTSQARTKRGNRRSERLLHEAELWAATAAVRLGTPYPAAELQEIWREVLLLQFHDILPGSCIAWVYQEAAATYADVERRLEHIIASSLGALAGEGDLLLTSNAGPYARSGVTALGVGKAMTPGEARVEVVGDGFALVNDLVRAVVDGRGLLVSLVDLATGREAVPQGQPGNLLQLHRDVPTQWDAWDVDESYRRQRTDLVSVDGVDGVDGVTASVDGQEATVRVRRTFGASSVVQHLVLRAGAAALDIRTEVDWHEQQKFLKLAFPLDLHTDRAASEIQFGHLFRPIHTNTSWDAARFETCAQRWVHVGEPGFGVAVANDSTYGHDITRTSYGDDGGRTPAGLSITTVRLSLLRSALYPDPSAEEGVHVSTCSVRPGATVADAVAEGYALNLPLRELRGARAVEPVVSVEGAGVVVETVKLAQDGSGDLVVRLYEAHGGRQQGVLTPGLEVSRVVETDLMEDPVSASSVQLVGGVVSFTLRPFQILTLRLVRD